MVGMASRARTWSLPPQRAQERYLRGSQRGLPLGDAGASANVLRIVIAPKAAATLYAQTNGAGLFKSTNGGSSWAALSTPVATRYAVLAVDPVATASIYVGADNASGTQGPLASTTGGTGFTAIGPAAIPASADVALDGTLCLGTSASGIFQRRVRSSAREGHDALSVFVASHQSGWFTQSWPSNWRNSFGPASHNRPLATVRLLPCRSLDGRNSPDSLE